jgi:PAS domain S-box-containing protein
MSLRLRLITPALIAAAVLCTLAGLLSRNQYIPLESLPIIAVVIVVVAWLIVERYARQPILRLAERIYALIHKQQTLLPLQLDSTLAVLENAAQDLAAAFQQRNEALLHEQQLRRQAESVLHESEQRHALALRCVSDGLWEWDLKSNRVYYAPAWKAALGYSDSEIGDDLTEWHNRIHPEQRVQVLQQLDTHLRADGGLFECDQRLLHRDGSYRWFLTRGRALRSANGKPYKVIGLNTDIGPRKRTEAILEGIARGLTAASGAEFFKVIVKNFAEVLQVKYAFITECIDRPPTRVRMLAAWTDGAYSEHLEYDLANTPCDITIGRNQLNLIPSGLAQLYPLEEGFESYLGIPICSAAGMVIGHLACLDVKPMQDGLPTLPIFTLFALRAGMEMEHQLLKRELRL